MNVEITVKTQEMRSNRNIARPPLKQKVLLVRQYGNTLVRRLLDNDGDVTAAFLAGQPT